MRPLAARGQAGEHAGAERAVLGAARDRQKIHRADRVGDGPHFPHINYRSEVADRGIGPIAGAGNAGNLRHLLLLRGERSARQARTSGRRKHEQEHADVQTLR